MAPDEELKLLREVAVRAELTLLEQRREFPRGEFSDLDDLEDALNTWKARSTDPTTHQLPATGELVVDARGQQQPIQR